MNAYTCGDDQNHLIIAEDMESAVRAYRKEYREEPEELKLFSEYVIIAEESTT